MDEAVQALTADGQGGLYAVSAGRIERLDPATGTTQAIAAADADTTRIAVA